MKKHSYRLYATVLYELTKDADERALPEILTPFISLLRKHRVMSRIPAIIDAFERYAEEREGIRRVKITTARRVSDELLKKIAQGIIEDKLAIEHVVDASLIGGMKAEMNHTVIDASIQGQLKQLYTHLTY